MDKKGEYQDFPSKTFCLTVSNIFVGEPFSVSLISGIENFQGKIVKIFDTTETRTQNQLLENAVVLILLLSFIFE